MRARDLSVVLGFCLVVSGCGGDVTRDAEQARGPLPTPAPVAQSVSPDTGRTERAAAPPAGVQSATTAATGRPAPAAAATHRPTATRDDAEQPAAREPAPIAAGIYRYDTRGTRRVADGPSRPMPSMTTLSVDQPDGRRQRQVRDLRDANATGTVVEQVLQYDADGVRLAFLRLTATFAGVSNSYAFTPSTPPLVISAGFPPGTQQFVLEGDGVRLETTVTVGARKPVTVGGERVEAAGVTFDSRLSGRLSGTERAVRGFDVDRGVLIGEDVRSEVTSGGVRLRTDYRADLTSLRPS